MLGLDADGRLVVAELKRDLAPDTVELQALKYAAMASRFTEEDLAAHHARFLAGRDAPVSDEDALQRLYEHAPGLSPETLRSPRVVLLAGGYPSVVTTTAVWLHEVGLDIRLLRYQAYRTRPADTGGHGADDGGQVLLSISQLYPPPDVEDFTVAPRRAEARTGSLARQQRRDASRTRRLLEAGVLVDGAELHLRVRGEGLTDEQRARLQAWIDEDPRRGQAAWRDDLRAQLTWALDGTAGTPSGLAQHVVEHAIGARPRLQGTLWWQDADGRTLVDLADALDHTVRHLHGTPYSARRPDRGGAPPPRRGSAGSRGAPTSGHEHSRRPGSRYGATRMSSCRPRAGFGPDEVARPRQPMADTAR